MSRANWGNARNQIYALRPDILGLAAEGKTVEEIRRALIIKLDGIGTRTFLRHASDIIKDSRTAHLRRLLDDNLITPEEFTARDTARVGSQKPWLGLIPKPAPAATPSSTVSTTAAPTPARAPAQPQHTPTAPASPPKPSVPFKHNPTDTDSDLW